MNIFKQIFFKIRVTIREFIGLYRWLKSQRIYNSKTHPVYLSDRSIDSPKRLRNESFESFFMKIEEIRNYKAKRISKNVPSSLTYFSTASIFIPFLIKKCGLKKNYKVLDYGSGGLRCGFGLLEFLEPESYSCADISKAFLLEARRNSYLLNTLFDFKQGKFYEINNDKIPEDFYDLIISTYVVPHIPKNKLFDYFSSIKKYLNKEGVFYFDFMPTTICLTQNVTTFTYPYRIIINEMNHAGLELIKTYGSAIVAKRKK